MSLSRSFVSKVVFPLQERLKGHDTISLHRQMERTQWLSPAEVKELQCHNLRHFLSSIGKNVPYYAQLFGDAEFDPESVYDVADLRKLPLLDKPTIRAHTDSMKAVGAKGLKRFNTGGSSGEPLIFYLGKERVSHDVAAKRRATRWWGVDIGDPEIVVWGSPIELGAQDRIRLMRDKIFNTQLLSAFEMSEENLQIFVDQIKQCCPKMLFGYPSALAHIARYAEQHHHCLDNLGIKVAFVTSERLYEHQRQRIQSVFGCPVANGYGGRDAGFIAHECPERGFHITAEDIVVEIVGADGAVLPDGEIGEIVVTHLFTSEFPFVRYRTGDVGALSSEVCSCGRGLPVLASLEGRTTDFVTAADGRLLHGLALIYVLRELPDVQEFRIVQETQLRIRIELVVEKGDSLALEADIRKQFHRRLGDAVTIEIEYLDEIPREKSGKFRYVISKLDQTGQR